ncbi:MAG: hypothetical protein A2X61_12345 [Ignavibacteria bacterium GWB2_35_12]|nr:MAG: hypothetical protein A2X63_02490 [Ignavibacteria bacterium GWA2_35_8]OGU41581.1 MAG: hypothetical protein A2X61_12345 [Ignavibacteria bacterium GWB2_35_12]OGU86975.1 MAG: hypothetical protein A2220_06170 [Ignavibacteria bacterium RIFOXYA2_FULL_35_10]OGV24914.1 MAG: hypothetical protein A2475_16190 [Ignavibacteria bacterium RIFOXYC2_FULL_35_21]
MDEFHEITYSQEVLRKSIHLMSLSIPITYTFIPQSIGLSILIPLTILFIVIDVLSKKRNKAQFFVRLIFGRMLRRHEVEKEYTLNGASWVLISATIGILVFPKILFVTGFSILILSDIAAALFGRKFGKTPLFDKSWEGTSAFIIIAFFIVSFIGYMTSAPWTFFVFGFISAFLGGMVEAASRMMKVDDNITIPICIGVLMWIGEYVSDYLFHLSYINLLH